MGIRQALAIATVERYCGLIASFGLTVVVSRLLTPEEIGIWAIGVAIIAFFTSAREFAPAAYLIQKLDLTAADVRSAATVIILISIVVCGVLGVLAPWLAGVYGEPRLIPYLRVASVAALFDVVALLITSLMRREMAFAEVAIINITGNATFLACTLALAALGFSYMSFAWACVASAVLTAMLALALRPDIWMFKPLLQGCRGILAFGACNGANVLLYRLFEAAPTMVLGRLISLDAAGHFARALLVCQLPDRALLGGVAPVLLPALSAELRAGRDLKQPYLRALALITCLHWPILIGLAILAHPVIQILLGSQWLGTVVLVQTIAPALIFSSANELNYPLLVSVGAMRDVLLRGLIAWPISAAIAAAAAIHSIEAAALSFLIILPLQAYISMCFVRRHVPIEWLDLARATWRSGVITLLAIAGPLSIVAAQGFRFDLTILQGILTGVLGAGGWLAGLHLTQHPMLGELERMRDVVFTRRKAQ